MKVKISKTKLEAALKVCEKYTERKDVSAIASHFLFTANANDNTLVITSTDYELGLIYTIRGVNVLASGSVTAPAKQALNIVSKLDKDEDIILEFVGNDCIISQGAFKFNLASFCYEDFPDYLSEILDKKILNVDSKEFVERLKLIEHAIAKNNPKLSLNGACVTITSNKIEFAGTDTKRLAISRIEGVSNDVDDINSIFVDFEENADDENVEDKTQAENQKAQTRTQFVIPRKAIAEMQKLFENDEVELSIVKIGATSYATRFLVATSANFVFFTKLINDRFPDYERIIPQKFCKTLNFSVKHFQGYLKKMAIVSDNAFMGLKTDDKLIFGSDGFTDDGVSAVIDKKLEMPKDYVLAFKIRFFTDFLNQIDEINFDLKLPDEEGYAFMLVSEKISLVAMPVADGSVDKFRAKFGFQAPLPEKAETDAQANSAEQTDEVA